MNLKRSLTRGACATVAIVALLGAASPALARVSEKNGAVKAETSNGEKTLTVYDTKGDNNDVYSNMTRSGVSGTPNLRNSNGHNSSASRTYLETILSIQACIDDFAGDTCDSWR